MNSIIVQKYGGMGLATPEKLKVVAQEIQRQHQAGQSVVVVVSAMGKTTDQLIQLAYQVSARPARRELDMLLSTGERISMSLMSMALTDLGVPAISFTGSQAGVLTSESHSSAQIVDVRPIRVIEELRRGRVVVLAGFQGVNPVSKEITTLGRGGSDTTAVAMAAALKADGCEIIKEVDGICSADPRVVSNCHSYAELDFSSLLEMCFWGAKVLHFRSVELARRANVPLVIKKLGAPNQRTVIKEKVDQMEVGKVLSVNSHPRIEHLEIQSQTVNEGFEKLEHHLDQHSFAWPQILASAHQDGATRVMITSDEESLDALMQTFAKSNIIRRRGEPMSSVSLTCYGSVNSDLTANALRVLSTQQINVDKVLLNSQTITFVVPQTLRDSAIKTLHNLVT